MPLHGTFIQHTPSPNNTNRVSQTITLTILSHFPGRLHAWLETTRSLLRRLGPIPCHKVLEQ